MTVARSAAPLFVLEPWIDDHGSAVLMLLNPSGGLAGADHMRCEVELGCGAHACLTTPSATRVYRARQAPTVVETTIRLEARSILEYVPDHLILHAGAALHQSLQIELGPASRAFIYDAFSAGRIARGECWQFRELANDVSVLSGNQPLFISRQRLRPAERLPAAPGVMDGYHYLATCGAFSADRFEGERLAARMNGLIDGAGEEVSGAADMLSAGSVVATVLTRSASALGACLRQLWAAARSVLCGLPPLDLRKY